MSDFRQEPVDLYLKERKEAKKNQPYIESIITRI
jgi:hypothetical protein